MKPFPCLLSIVSFLFLSVPVLGQPPQMERPSPWSVGVIVLTDSQPYTNADGIVRVFPSVVYRGEKLQVLGPLVRYKFYKNDWVTLNANAAVQFTPYEEGDSDILNGLDEPDPTLIGGVSARVSLRQLDLPMLSLTFTAEGDLLGEHNGLQATAGAEYTFGKPWLPLSGGLGAGVLVQDENWTDYFVGVPVSKQTEDRAAYDASSSVNPYLTFRLMFRVTPSWSLMGIARLELLDPSYTDSPLVSDDTRTTTFVGLNYTF